VYIDLPTGLETDTGTIHGGCVKATATVTMAHLKRGLLFSPGREHAGRIIVADIGIPKEVSQQSGVNCFQLNAKFIQKVLPERPLNIFKNRCGQVFLLAGSVGLTGAATLSSEAALRIGAGMAFLGVPNSLNLILEEKLTEVMTLPLPETETQSLSFAAQAQIAEKFEWTDVLAIGPGLTTHPDSVKLVKWVLEKFDKPIILDADALNCLKGETAALKKRAKGDLILTPHPGELSRIIGLSTKEILANPIEIARSTAQKFNVVLILKGAPTIIAAPDGCVFINSTGNPGMATAGMGDVLTGVVAGLVAQGLSPLDGALAGVYLHGYAGDLAKSELGEAGLLAGDVLRYLPQARNDHK
jgi:NAD(P)H-hydrate epimerase